MADKIPTWIYAIASIVLAFFAGWALGHGGHKAIDYDKIFPSGEKCNLVVEQRVACYKGCQFLTQSLFGIVDLNRTSEAERINQYTLCTTLCEYKYFVTFTDKGDAFDCSYHELR